MVKTGWISPMLTSSSRLQPMAPLGSHYRDPSDPTSVSHGTARRNSIEDRVRTNGAVLMDKHAANTVLAGYPA
jgi:hypothetical protein